MRLTGHCAPTRHRYVRPARAAIVTALCRGNSRKSARPKRRKPLNEAFRRSLASWVMRVTASTAVLAAGHPGPQTHSTRWKKSSGIAVHPAIRLRLFGANSTRPVEPLEQGKTYKDSFDGELPRGTGLRKTRKSGPPGLFHFILPNREIFYFHS